MPEWLGFLVAFPIAALGMYGIGLALKAYYRIALRGKTTMLSTERWWQLKG